MTDRRPPHPVAYLVLYLPFGAVSGYVAVTLGYLLRGGGVSVAAIAGLSGLFLLPNVWKVLWAPLIDTTLSARAWYVIGAGATALVFFAAGFVPIAPASAPVFALLSFVGGVSSSVAGMGAERLMAYSAPENQKGRAGGWSQAGNLGGAGLGGGAGLWISQHLAPWLGAAALGALSLACMSMLFAFQEGRHERGQPYLEILKHAGRDVLGLALRRIGMLACFICLLPMGTGAAAYLWGAVARDWGASADQVALITGALSGVAAMIGALAGGYLCDRMDRKGGYALFALALAACAVAMALGPRTPAAFMLFTMLYSLAVGGCYGAFGALTLEAIGQGAAATKYNLIASLANAPILTMTLVDSAAQTRWGSGGMLLTEAAAGVGAVAFFYAAVWISRDWSWTGLRRRIGLTPA